MSWKITPSNLLVDDADALAYLTAVEAADTAAGQSGGLESGVRLAVNAFVKGCKADGIWNAIKASCILAGARTLNGALVPLVGPAPTNFNFVQGDYDRRAGVAGDRATKYLDSNRSCNADPQNSQHVAVFATSYSGFFEDPLIGASTSTLPDRTFILLGSSTLVQTFSRSGPNSISVSALTTGFSGISRSASNAYSVRHGTTDYTVNASSNVSTSNNILLYRRPSSSFWSSSRLAFYSIGEALNLALLDARVTALINAFAAAIP